MSDHEPSDHTSDEYVTWLLNEMSQTVTSSSKLTKREKGTYAHKVMAVLDGLSNGDQMTILEVCMALHYTQFKTQFGKDDEMNQDALEKLIALLMAMRMTHNVGNAVFDRMKITFVPDVLEDLSDDGGTDGQK